jgi:uncharacterized membrane protein YqjE
MEPLREPLSDATQPSGVRPLGNTIAEIASGLKDVARAEIRLAKAELARSASITGNAALRIGVFGVVASLGILPFLGFLVIGLGELLNGNYWLSSLIVSLVLFAVGGLVAYLAFKKLKSEDLTLPVTRRALDQGVDRIGRQVSATSSEIGQTVKHQAAGLKELRHPPEFHGADDESGKSRRFA